MLEIYDRHAVISLAARLIQNHGENTRDHDVKTELEQRIAARNATIGHLENALKALGYDLNIEGVWPRIIEEFGDALRAIIHPAQSQEQSGQTHDTQISQVIPPSQPQATISTLVLERLRSVGSRGSKSTSIGAWLKSSHNIETHYKTVGMTLYRLSQESPPKVHRNGHTWFFGPRPAETKNPDVDAPGRTSLLDKEGGTDA